MSTNRPTPAIGELLDGLSGAPLGTAFAITPGLGFTCWHCVELLVHGGAVSLVLRVPRTGGRDEVWCEASLLDYDRDLDIALLRFDPPLPEQLEPVVLLPVAAGDPSIRVEDRRWHTVAWPSHTEVISDGVDLRGAVGSVRPSPEGRDQLQVDLDPSKAGSPLRPHQASGAPVRVTLDGAHVAIGMVARFRAEPDGLGNHGEVPVGGLVFAVTSDDLLALAGDRLPARNPFPRPLRPLGEHDASSFSGRSHALKTLREATHEATLSARAGFVTLRGPSGSGKSSLVRAGLIGGLRADDPWRPGRILVLDNYVGVEPQALAPLTGGTASAPALLVLDQLEQLLAEPPATIDRFWAAVCALRETHNRTTVLLVIRTDHLQPFEERHPEIGSALRAGDRYGSSIDLKLTRDDLADMVVQPARRAGIVVDKEVVERIVAGIGPAAPPALVVLGITLWRLAEQLGQVRVITKAHYSKIGGIAGAISRWADDALDSAGAVRTLAFERVLVRLVRVGERPNVPSTRAYVDRKALEALTDAASGTAAALATLERAGLVYETGLDDDATVVALTHDALLTEWPALRQLVHKLHDVLRWKTQSFDGPFREREVLRGRALAEAKRHARPDTRAAFSHAELRFVARSARTARWRLARVAATLALAVVVSGLAARMIVHSHAGRDDAIAADAANRLRDRGEQQAAGAPLLARSLFLEAYRQQPGGVTGRSALAEAMLLAPGLVAEAQTPQRGGVALPDLSAVLGPDVRPSSDGAHGVQRSCFHVLPVTSGSGGPRERTPYCMSGAPSDPVWAVSHDARLFASVWAWGRHVSVSVWRRGDHRPVWSCAVKTIRLRPDRPTPVIGIAVADSGTAAVDIGGQLYIYSNGSCRPVRLRGQGDPDAAASVAISADGHTVLLDVSRRVSRTDPKPRSVAWAFGLGDRLALLGRFAHPDAVRPVLAPDGRSVITTDRRGIVRWPTRVGGTGRLLLPSTNLTLGANALAVSPDSRTIAAANADGAVVEAGIDGSPRRTVRLSAPFTGSATLHVGDTGDALVGGDELWRRYSAQLPPSVMQVYTTDRFGLGVATISVSPDGRHIAVLSWSGRTTATGEKYLLSLIDTTSGRTAPPVTVPMAATLTWKAGGGVLLSDRDGRLTSVDLAGRVRSLGAWAAIAPIAVDPHGRFAAMKLISGPPVIAVVDLRTGAFVHRFHVPADVHAPLALSSNGTVTLVADHRLALIHRAFADDTAIDALPLPPHAHPPVGMTSRLDQTLTGQASAGGITVVTPSAQTTMAGISSVIVAQPSTGARSVVRMSAINGVAPSATRVGFLGRNATRYELLVTDVHGRKWLELPEADPTVSAPDAHQGDGLIGLSDHGDDLALASASDVVLLKLDPRAWAAALCATAPKLSAQEYALYAGTGAARPLCP
jgi:hypothetical protein